MRWDVFCKVIDNHGDAGVCWRLARELAERGEDVRLWLDDPSMVGWMAPEGHPRVHVLAWGEQVPKLEPGDVAVEAFGCDPPASFVDAMAGHGTLWINLEYLSAEGYVERSHGLRSPVREGVEKFFFYPGFTARTGGLLREQDLAQRQAKFDAAGWLRCAGIDPAGGRCVSLFCYEPPALVDLLRELAAGREPTRLLVTAGRAAAAVRGVLATAFGEEPSARRGAVVAPGEGHERVVAGPAINFGALSIRFLPLLSQLDYDHLLWACDFNFVRGEDSLVRAIWAGKPFAWQLYPQPDLAHFEKLRAFLDWLAPPPDLAQLFVAWNGAPGAALPPFEPPAWKAAAEAARSRALALPELAAGLLQLARGRGRISGFAQAPSPAPPLPRPS